MQSVDYTEWNAAEKMIDRNTRLVGAPLTAYSYYYYHTSSGIFRGRIQSFLPQRWQIRTLGQWLLLLT